MQAIFSNWHLMRILRLVLGVMIIVQAVETREWMIGLMGVAFSTMALFNYGCCGVNGCDTTPTSPTNKSMQEITYERVD